MVWAAIVSASTGGGGRCPRAAWISDSAVAGSTSTPLWSYRSRTLATNRMIGAQS